MMLEADARDAVFAIAHLTLKPRPVEELVQVSVAVQAAIDVFRVEFPLLCPQQSAGLLGDFATTTDVDVAWMMERLSHPEIVRISEAANGTSPVMTYILIQSCYSGSWDSFDTGTALSYVVQASKRERNQLTLETAALLPLAAHGQRFKAGKTVGALGPIAKKVRKFMLDNPHAKASEVWMALKKSPPKGHEFRESTRLGKYVEHGADTVMEWARFKNLVSEHRPATAKRKRKTKAVITG